MPLKSRTNSKKKKSTKNAELSGFIRIQIYALIIYFVMFFAFSLVCLATDLSKDYTYYVSLALFSVSSFLVGFISGTKIRQNGLVTGVLHALPMNLLLLVTSLVFNGFKADYSALISAVVMILASAVGGIVSVNIKVRK